MFGDLPSREFELGFGDDVVAIEHASRLVPADRHDHFFGDSAVHHVSNRAPPQVVKNLSDVSRLDFQLRAEAELHTARLPDLAQSLNSNSMASLVQPIADVGARRLTLRVALPEQRGELRDDGDRPALAVLRLAGVERDRVPKKSTFSFLLMPSASPFLIPVK